ncbi:hypothetical protein UB31_27910 [Bradyrhizobium sp. LTSP849]|uniref:hypothetical protein n=1 Tax=Bradyrhizobium sp. LTSP849 TaxID=1615890 RepID=UPI0005D1D10D|nr:hypothetical protein [Bradyrhizobium sp. LTSP849]KJC40133.1 hypothetical protein UB31_27910 [Bradyrhizobium sp. LTSP849]
MASYWIGVISALAIFASSIAVAPTLGQPVECAQADGAPQVCGLTALQINDLKKMVDQFQAENQKHSPGATANGVVPKDAEASCVKVDNFKATCGLTGAQLAQVSRQIAAYKPQSP